MRRWRISKRSWRFNGSRWGRGLTNMQTGEAGMADPEWMGRQFGRSPPTARRVTFDLRRASNQPEQWTQSRFLMGLSTYSRNGIANGFINDVPFCRSRPTLRCTTATPAMRNQRRDDADRHRTSERAQVTSAMPPTGVDGQHWRPGNPVGDRGRDDHLISARHDAFSAVATGWRDRSSTSPSLSPTATSSPVVASPRR